MKVIIYDGLESSYYLTLLLLQYGYEVFIYQPNSNNLNLDNLIWLSNNYKTKVNLIVSLNDLSLSSIPVIIETDHHKQLSQLWNFNTIILLNKYSTMNTTKVYKIDNDSMLYHIPVNNLKQTLQLKSEI